MKKSRKIMMWSGLILLSVILVVGGGILLVEQTGYISSKEIFAKSVWGTLWCKELPTVQEKYDLVKDGSKVDRSLAKSIYCGTDKNGLSTAVSVCRIGYDISDPARFGSTIDCQTRKCNRDETCEPWLDASSFDLLNGQKLYISCKKGFGLQAIKEGEINLYNIYTPFHLVNQPIYGETIAFTTYGCTIPSSMNDKVKLEDKGRTLNLGTEISYVAGTALAPIQGNTYDWKGKTVVCSGTNLYEITKTTLGSGNILLTEENYPIATKTDGIECCPSPGNSICGTDFKWTETPIFDPGKKCTTAFPSTLQPAINNEVCIFTCKNGITTKSDCKINECNNCAGVCDQNYNCISPGGGEVKTTPKQDKCEASGGVWIDKKIETCGFMCNMGLSKPTITSEPYCKETNYLLYIILGIFGIIALLLIIQPKKQNTDK